VEECIKTVIKELPAVLHKERWIYLEGYPTSANGYNQDLPYFRERWKT
jgi:hypothetical protein